MSAPPIYRPAKFFIPSSTPKSSSNNQGSSSSSSSASSDTVTIRATATMDGRSTITTTNERTGETTTVTSSTPSSSSSSGSSSSRSRSSSQIKQDLAKEAETEALRPKIVEASTGKVIDEGNFRVNRDFERRQREFNRSEIRKQEQAEASKQKNFRLFEPSITRRLEIERQARENQAQPGVFVQEKPTFTDRTRVGNIFDKVGAGAKNLAYDLSFKADTAEKEGNLIKATGFTLGAFTLGAAVATKEFIVDPLRTPIQSVKEAVGGAVSLATSPAARKDFSTQAGIFGAKLQSGDPIATSQAVVAVGSPSVPSLAIRGTAKITKEIKFIGKPEFQISEFAHSSTPQTQFPRARGTQEIIQKLKESDNTVVTFSPQRLGKVDPETFAPTSNPFIGRQISGDTRKGSLGLEDGGINVAPKGAGNPYFLRITPTDNVQYSINPKRIFESIKREFDVPTITEFKTRGAVKPPERVLKTPGFEDVKIWQREQLAGTGQVTLTKRSLIGFPE
jgi:hypothetical protein